MTRLGVYGGSFDPIHRGHVEPVRAAVDQLSLDRVLYLPTAAPPHKPGVEMAPIARRFAMVELALLDEPRLQVSDLEMRAAPSYTVETLERLRSEVGDAELWLLIGADSLAAIESWRRWDELFELARVAVLRRPRRSRRSIAADASPELAERLGVVTWIDNPPVDLSATEIRHRLRAGESPPTGALEPSVLHYVRKYRLYT